MAARGDDDIRIRPGRIRPGHRGAKRPSSFVGEVMRAAKKAGQRASAERGRTTLDRPSGEVAAPPWPYPPGLRPGASSSWPASCAIVAASSSQRRSPGTSPISSAKA
jgi:hypothetical protein